MNNKAKWSKQNVANCFCKVRNHTQCFTLNTSGKYHCCFRIKDLNAVSNPKFSETFKVRDRDETLAERDRDETETLKNMSRDVSRDRDTSGDIQLCSPEYLPFLQRIEMLGGSNSSNRLRDTLRITGQKKLVS